MSRCLLARTTSRVVTPSIDIAIAGLEDLPRVLLDAGSVGLAQLKLLVCGFKVHGLCLGARVLGLRRSLPTEFDKTLTKRDLKCLRRGCGSGYKV